LLSGENVAGLAEKLRGAQFFSALLRDALARGRLHLELHPTRPTAEGRLDRDVQEQEVVVEALARRDPVTEGAHLLALRPAVAERVAEPGDEVARRQHRPVGPRELEGAVAVDEELAADPECDRLDRIAAVAEHADDRPRAGELDGAQRFRAVSRYEE